MYNLKPCPFCGSEFVRIVDWDDEDGKTYWARCEKCYVSTQSYLRKKDIIEAWNRRVNNAPVVDAVPVVRCKDCAYFGLNDENVPYCFNRFGLDEPEPNGFCNYGVKKNE